jgi:hypothetical protein
VKSALDTFWAWRERIAAHHRGEDYGVTWDIETERLDPASPTLCIAWAQGMDPVGFSGNMLDCPEWLDCLSDGQLLIAHNMKYEAQSLIARGIDPRKFVWWDTMLGEWVLLANNPRGLGLNLDETSQRYGGTPKDPYVDQMIKDGRVCEIEPGLLRDRNAKDVADTQMVARRQMERQTEAQIRLTIVRSMMALELAYIEGIPSKGIGGMRLDPVRVREECERNAAEIREHEDALRDITRGANPKSVNEMAPVLFGVWPADVKEEDRGQLVAGCQCGVRWTPKKGCTQCKALPTRAPVVEPLGFAEDKETRTKPTKNWPDGKPSIAKEVMAELATKARTPRQKTWAKHYLALTEALAERDKNLTFFRGVCEQAGGIAFAELMQGVTATHRLSCRSRLRVTVDGKEYGCQLQNIPRHLKGCFVAKDTDYLTCSVDQSQAEFRGAIFLGDDPQGREDIVNPRFDAHIQTLTVMLHGPNNFDANYGPLFDRYKAGDKEVKYQRADNQLCKGHTFKPLFGGSSGTDRERAYYKWFGQRYSGVTATQNEWDKEVQQTGRYEAPTGMVFSWDRTWTVNKWGRDSMVSEHTGRSLFSIVRNLPIQYFATGELATVATLCLLYECRAKGLRYSPVMLTHDDTKGEIHKDDQEAWHAACSQAYGPMAWRFLLEVYDVNYDVELAAESQIGVRFGEGSTRDHAFTSPLTEDIENMKLTAKSGGDGAPKVPAKTHLAIINAVVDLGVQPGSAKFPKPKRKIYIGYEFPGIVLEYQARDDKPASKGPARLGSFFSLSMNEKATFRKVVESLEGKPFGNGAAGDRAACAFDPKSLLGRVCMAPVTHKVVGETIYANVGTPLPPVDGMPVDHVKMAEEPHYYDTDQPDELSFKRLPQFLQDMINARVIPSHGGNNSPAPLTGGLQDLGQE